jgi:hypothetical protein
VDHRIANAVQKRDADSALFSPCKIWGRLVSSGDQSAPLVFPVNDTTT